MSRAFVQVFMGDSIAKHIPYSPNTTIADLKVQLLEKLDIKSLPEDYHIFEIAPGKGQILDDRLRVADIIGKWPVLNEPYTVPPYRLVCKKLFLDADQLSFLVDPSDNSRYVMFLQARQTLRNCLFPVEAGKLAKLGVYYLAHQFGPYTPQKDRLVSERVLRQVLPLDQITDQLLDQIAELYKQSIVMNLTPERAEQCFLEEYTELEIASVTVFQSKYAARDMQKMNLNVLIGVSKDGVTLYDATTNHKTAHYTFAQLVSWSYNEDIFLLKTLDPSTGAESTQQFQTNFNELLCVLINGYVARILQNIEK